ncbi:677_t:CDS:10 [Funneliformis mosseae]|uniref:677_t:CDS:1 n=1 Tax=Funneliformis mosseae TaxID=27381 RepID=A0A9N9BPT1_FUNMO|nr:677_t:CDS:10 [Funneliformis mosseae]
MKLTRQPKWGKFYKYFALKDVRAEAGAQEQAWADPSTKVVPKNDYGHFYSGDSYIVLHSYKKNDKTEALAHDIHYWLGLDSSQDEVGTAAYKTVELDDFLGTSPVQHREVQGCESNLFLSYFKQFQVEDGGIESGFNRLKPVEYRHRLLKLKQIKRTVVVREVLKDYTSLNSGDVFILDVGTTLYQLNGKHSQGSERIKAAEFVRAIEGERQGACNIIVIDEGDREMGSFWDALGSKGDIKPADEDTAEDMTKIEHKLLRVSDSSGKLTFKEEATGTITRDQFDTNDVFVFDAGHEVFVWIGKNSTVKEKKYSLQYAQDYIQKYNRPAYLPITRVMEGGENETFESALITVSTRIRKA